MKIICIGRNYAKHAAELNNPIPDDPLIFTKPPSALTFPGQDFVYPAISKDVHYECELVLRIGKKGSRIAQADALSHVDAVALGIDFTARDVQSRAKEKRHPWALAKGFDGSAPISDFRPISQFPDLTDLHYTCELNGEPRQHGHTALMLFPCDYIIHYVSQYFTLEPGDLIFTGTPEGVGAVQVGDRLTGSLAGEAMLDFQVVS